MKGSLLALLALFAGCLTGYSLELPAWLTGHELSTWLLYALMAQVGMSIGSSRNLHDMVNHFKPRILLLPLATALGTLCFSALAPLLLDRWSLTDCLAVGSGFGYYSLSSLLITQLKQPALGMQLAAELGTIALLTNIFREIIALVGAPLLQRRFGTFVPISVAGVTSMDVALPTLVQSCGQQVIPLAIFHGAVLDMSVPFLVSLFCGL